LASVPLLFLVASRLDLPMPRLRWAFYAYYPLHLAALWLIRIPHEQSRIPILLIGACPMRKARSF
jgi:hypothetical protein